MKKPFTSFLLSVALSCLAFGASAQVVKCKGHGGKVIYSDVPCQDGGEGQKVNTQANVLDGANDRRDADAMRSNSITAKREQEVNAIVQNPPAQCKFQYFSIGDKKGQELAKLAKRECAENVVAERNGEPTKDRYYRLWNDQHQAQSTNRAGIAAQQAAAARNNRTIRCTPDGFGGANCR